VPPKTGIQRTLKITDKGREYLRQMRKQKKPLISQDSRMMLTHIAEWEANRNPEDYCPECAYELDSMELSVERSSFGDGEIGHYAVFCPRCNWSETY